MLKSAKNGAAWLKHFEGGQSNTVALYFAPPCSCDSVLLAYDGLNFIGYILFSVYKSNCVYVSSVVRC